MKPELPDHRKFLRLCRLLDEPPPHVLGYLLFMWRRCYQTGDSRLGDALDVEAAACYLGEPGKFAKAASEAGGNGRSGFIEEKDGVYHVHDLWDHAPEWAKRRMARVGNMPDGVEEYAGIRPNVSRTGAKGKKAASGSSPRGGKTGGKRSVKDREKKEEDREEKEEEKATGDRPSDVAFICGPPCEFGDTEPTPEPEPAKTPRVIKTTYARVVDKFSTLWKERHKVKFSIGGREGDNFKQLIADADNDEPTLLRAIELFFEKADAKTCEAKHPLGYLLVGISRWMAEAKASFTPGDSVVEAAKKSDARLESTLKYRGKPMELPTKKQEGTNGNGGDPTLFSRVEERAFGEVPDRLHDAGNRDGGRDSPPTLEGRLP